MAARQECDSIAMQPGAAVLYGRLQLDDPMSLHEELLAMKGHIHGSKGHSDVGVSDTAARTFRGLFRRLFGHYK